MSAPESFIDDAVRGAIEDVYRAFGRYRCPIAIHGYDFACDRTHPLLSKPLRQLTPADLDSFLSDVLYTCGTTEDFKYFLPRMIETVCESTTEYATGAKVGVIEPNFVFTKLIYESQGCRRYTRWPASERSAIDAFFAAAWLRVLQCPVPTIDDEQDVWYICESGASDWLTYMGAAGADITVPLRAWDETDTLAADLQLAQLIIAEHKAINRQAPTGNAFMPRKTGLIVTEWIRRRETSDRLVLALERVDHRLDEIIILRAGELMIDLRL